MVQVFFLVVVFGLFHGLVFLPVILALVGPTHSPTDPHHHQQTGPGEKYELEKLKPAVASP